MSAPAPSAPASSSPAFPVWIALIGAFICGAGIAAQARINGELSDRIGDGFVAATISFGSGLVILLIVLAFWKPGRTGLAAVRDALRERRMPVWHVLGGFAGAFFVLSQGLAIGLIGVALFNVAMVAGQTLSGLGADRIGLGPSGRHPLTPRRLIGALIALAAVAWAVSAKLGSTDVAVWALILPFISGLGLGWQQAVNGRVRVVASSALTSTLINFAAGTVGLVIATAAHTIVVGLPEALPTELWLYSGGLIGCIFIAGNALIVRVTGVLLLTLGTVAGQLTTAVALDVLTPSAEGAVTVPTVGGAALALTAVIVASVRIRSRRTGAKT